VDPEHIQPKPAGFFDSIKNQILVGHDATPHRTEIQACARGFVPSAFGNNRYVRWLSWANRTAGARYWLAHMH